MLFIRKLKPKLNKQSDSIRAKLFTQRFFIIQSCRNFFFILCVYCFYVNILEFQPVSHQHFYNRLYIFKRIQKFLLFNLKMTVERSKRRCFLTLTFLVKSVSKNLLIRIYLFLELSPKRLFQERINKTTYFPGVAGYFNNNIPEHPGTSRNTESL